MYIRQITVPSSAQWWASFLEWKNSPPAGSAALQPPAVGHLPSEAPVGPGADAPFTWAAPEGFEHPRPWRPVGDWNNGLDACGLGGCTSHPACHSAIFIRIYPCWPLHMFLWASWLAQAFPSMGSLTPSLASCQLVPLGSGSCYEVDNPFCILRVFQDANLNWNLACFTFSFSIITDWLSKVILSSPTHPLHQSFAIHHSSSFLENNLHLLDLIIVISFLSLFHVLWRFLHFLNSLKMTLCACVCGGTHRNYQDLWL